MEARRCIVSHCVEKAQTEEDHREGGWSPYLCKKHDQERVEHLEKPKEVDGERP